MSTKVLGFLVSIVCLKFSTGEVLYRRARAQSSETSRRVTLRGSLPVSMMRSKKPHSGEIPASTSGSSGISDATAATPVFLPMVVCTNTKPPSAADEFRACDDGLAPSRRSGKGASAETSLFSSRVTNEDTKIKGQVQFEIPHGLNSEFTDGKLFGMARKANFRKISAVRVRARAAKSQAAKIQLAFAMSSGRSVCDAGSDA